MSPSSSKSKSKDKRVASKEPLKAPSKPTSNANTSGAFHILDTSNANARFRNIDEPNGNSVEYDCVSNNGSWSGESEDPKDKSSHGPPRSEASIPGADSEKREKIRQKNEKKHQRQKERRAQELHDRCCGFIMSRKLESLAQQLVAMGFPLERATMALILNEGKVEESVAWLFEGAEDASNPSEQNIETGGNLKVDISQELARIADMEVKYKCSKQEVERAVVACEGDLDQAAQNLMKTQKPEPPKPQESPTGGDGGKLLASRVQPKRAVNPDPPVEPGGKNVHLLKKVQASSEWGKPQQAVEKQWPVPVPVPQYGSVANELKSLQLGSVREPKYTTAMSPSMSPSAHVVDWNSNCLIEPAMGMSLNGFNHIPTSTRSFNTPSNFRYPPQIGRNVSSGQLWNRTVGAAPTLTAATSLGLFSGNGGPHADWNVADGTERFDYTNIDWSLNRIPQSPMGLGGSTGGLGMGLGGSTGGLGLGGGGGGRGGSREWTSPFEEKDLFSLPRHFVRKE